MYFAIIGNHPEITLKELHQVHPKNLKQISDHLITFDTNEADKLTNIASLIKRWEVLPFEEIENILTARHCEGNEVSRGNLLNKKPKILWIADKVMGINFKKKYGMKRFKQVDILHTDLDVKKKGIELVKIPPAKGDTPKGRGAVVEYGVVLGYQNIKLYEVIDFEKPGRSMQLGMMPAKLTHSLINIALSFTKNQEKTLIFDPFCWTGTTGFLANYFGYNFIGSDIKLNLALKNQSWREESRYYQDKLFKFYEQDISKPLDPNNFADLLSHETVIVTEGRLGPVIKQTTTAEEVIEYQRRVKNLYLQFIQTITNFFGEKRPPMVFTIPIYIGHENSIEEHITTLTEKLGRKIESIEEPYKREQHKVARKIIILR